MPTQQQLLEQELTDIFYPNSIDKTNAARFKSKLRELIGVIAGEPGQGPAGVDGLDGSDGAQGSNGAQGIQGIQGATGPAGADAAGGGGSYDILVEHRSTSGVGGGSKTNSGNAVMPLNTLEEDVNGIASLSSSQLTLPAGTYEVEFCHYGMGLGALQAQLRVGGSLEKYGMSVDTGVGTKWGEESKGKARVVLATETYLELWCYSTSGNTASDALGDITNNAYNIHGWLAIKEIV